MLFINQCISKSSIRLFQRFSHLKISSYDSFMDVWKILVYRCYNFICRPKMRFMPNLLRHYIRLAECQRVPNLGNTVDGQTIHTSTH